MPRRYARPPLGPPPDRRQSVQYALLHTVPGRAIVIGLVVRIAVYVAGLSLGTVPAFLGVIDTVAGVALAVGGAYFVFRLLVVARRRLLWRVRRKLILSYIFVGFIPVILIASFFLLCGFLLFYSFSSYLVQSRLRALSDRALFVAQSTALEIRRAGGRDVAGIIDQRQKNTAAEFPGISLVVVPVGRACADISRTMPPAAPAGSLSSAGPWSHVDVPAAVPGWVDCKGFSGVFAYTVAPPAAPGDAPPRAVAGDTRILVRAAAFPDSPRPGYVVIVDLPIGDELKNRLRQETGVEVKSARPRILNSDRVIPLPGHREAPAAPVATQASGGGLMGNLESPLEYRDWTSGETGTLMVTTQMSVSELYQRITAAQGSVGLDLSQGLLLALFIIGSLFLIIEFVALVAGLALAKSITGSVHELFTGTERVRQGDFTHKIAVKTEDQLGELSTSFNSMTASIEDLLRQAAEKKRLEEELRIAREIQMSLLPQGPLEMAGLSVTALCVPAREVGGDYYDFFRLGERRLGVLIADVSGKGTSAALYMAELKGLMLSLSGIHTSPRELLLVANRIIAANLDARSFITMTYAVIDRDAHTMTYARAGHTPLMYVPGAASRMDRRVRVLTPDGLVLGLNLDNGEMFERILEEETLTLHAGDVAVFFTDGITEAMNEADDFFGDARLARLVEEHAHLSCDELRERVLREVEAFVGTAPQHDDMTMILLKVEELPLMIGSRNAGAAEVAEVAEVAAVIE